MEAWTLLGALAASTGRVTLGALTSSMTLRNPVLLVQAAQTLRGISGGRAELALGAGGAPIDHDLTGTPRWTPRERAGRFAEFVPLVAGVLREGAPPATSSATYYPATGPNLPSAGGIRLTIAALGPRSIRLAAAHGDAWNSYGVHAGGRLSDSRPTSEEALDLFRERAARFDRACLAVGRDPATATRSYTLIESYVGPLLSDLNACISTARGFRDAGVTEFVVYWPADPTQEATLGPFIRALREM